MLAINNRTCFARVSDTHLWKIGLWPKIRKLLILVGQRIMARGLIGSGALEFSGLCRRIIMSTASWNNDAHE